MRVLFMGTPDFAVPVLKAVADKYEVVAVISQPDRPKGRGKKLQNTPVKEAALERNIPVYQPERIKSEEFTAFLKTIEADIYIVVAYGQILSQEILDIPPMGCVNVHASLLPRYRGAAPMQWAIINGDRKTGVTIMYMDKNCDTGDMILKEEMDILPDDTYESLHDRMSLVGADTLMKALELIEKGEAKRKKQDDSLSTHAPMITRDMGLIDWSQGSEAIRNKIRGFNPLPCAFTHYDGEVLKIYKAEICDGFDSGEYGEILAINKKKGFAVRTGDGALLVTEVQAKGGKRMNASDYMRGHDIRTGKILV